MFAKCSISTPRSCFKTTYKNKLLSHIILKDHVTAERTDIFLSHFQRFQSLILQEWAELKMENLERGGGGVGVEANGRPGGTACITRVLNNNNHGWCLVTAVARSTSVNWWQTSIWNAHSDPESVRVNCKYLKQPAERKKKKKKCLLFLALLGARRHSCLEDYLCMCMWLRQKRCFEDQGLDFTLWCMLHLNWWLLHNYHDKRARQMLTQLVFW